jgi:hypothetical protein
MRSPATICWEICGTPSRLTQLRDWPGGHADHAVLPARIQAATIAADMPARIAVPCSRRYQLLQEKFAIDESEIDDASPAPQAPIGALRRLQKTS